MKKLLFLISLCLLSQNFTIASESTGNTVPASVPVPMQPVKEPIPSFSVPIIQAPKILDNAEPVVEKEIKKDLPSRLHARRQMLKVLYPVTEVPAE